MKDFDQTLSEQVVKPDIVLRLKHKTESTRHTTASEENTDGYKELRLGGMERD